MTTVNGQPYPVPMILFLSVVVWTQIATPTRAEPCDITASPLTVTVAEGTENGTCVRQLSDTDNAKVVHYPDLTSPPFLHIVSGWLCLNATLILDTDQELCQYVEQNAFWTLYVTCDDGTTQHQIDVRVNLTDDLPPHFTSSFFSREVQEMALLQTTVLRFSGSDITDPDCFDNLQLGVNTLFSIEDGNTDGAFELTSQRTGVLVVGRWLDYEHGDRGFQLNISLADSNNVSLKSYTTVEVKVLDIDDSDPVFLHPVYHLTVREENTSSVGVWQQTDPPVNVTDPDVDVQPVDPPIVSLYSSGDESKVKVSESGQVQLQKTFDREQTSEFSVVLKVRQSVSQWRSSTATLSVEVSDINDNRPLFDPSAYHFSIPEHSAALTTVGVVFASDSDSGDNAIFSYKLLSHDALFSMETHEDGSFGVLRVKNSSQLDRERTPELMVTIGTEELRGKEGGDCSGGHCEVTVKVTLLDINDNSPVFDQTSYNVTVQDYVVHDVIITVHASDDDVGDNGDVRYAVRSDGSGVCGDVTVDAASGDVTLGRGTRETVLCSVLVDACDSPADPRNRRCTSVPLLVALHTSNYTVALYTSVSSEVLNPRRLELQRQLSDILGVAVTVINIGPASTTEGTEVLISATDTTTQEKLPRQRLQQLADEHAEEIRELFLAYQSTTPTSNEQSTDDFPPHVIALLVVAVLLLLAFVVALVLIYRGHERYRRQKRLMQHLSTPNAMYASTEVGKSDSASSTSTLPLCRQHRLDEVAEGVLNPVFQDDADASPGDRGGGGGGGGRGKVEGGRKGHGVGGGGRNPDADSGVPSDRENGAGESDPPSRETPSPSALPRPPPPHHHHAGPLGSAYLAAVLCDLVTSSPDRTQEEEDVDDMVDVTSPPPFYSDVTFDLYANSPAQSSLPKGSDRAEGSSVDRVRSTEASPLPEADDHHHLHEEIPRGRAEDAAKNVAGGMSCSEETGEVSGPPCNDPARMLGRVLHEHLKSSGQNQNQDQDQDHLSPDNGEKEEEGDSPGLGSRLGQLMRPSTPPMHRSRNEEEEEVESLPEEPEPDYAKKVRFSTQITALPGVDTDAQGSQDPHQVLPAEKTDTDPSRLEDDLATRAGEREETEGGADGNSSTLPIRPFRDAPQTSPVSEAAQGQKDFSTDGGAPGSFQEEVTAF